jgi:hypothetical protein
VVKKAIEEIEDHTTRESKRRQCALLLAKAGKTAEATDLALTIEDRTNREATLAKIAKGEFRD